MTSPSSDTQVKNVNKIHASFRPMFFGGIRIYLLEVRYLVLQCVRFCVVADVRVMARIKSEAINLVWLKWCLLCHPYDVWVNRPSLASTNKDFIMFMSGRIPTGLDTGRYRDTAGYMCIQSYLRISESPKLGTHCLFRWIRWKTNITRTPGINNHVHSDNKPFYIWLYSSHSI